MTAAAGNALGAKLASAGLGVITVFYGIGQALGPAQAGLIKDATGTFTYAFMLSAAVSCVGALLSLMMKKVVSKIL